MSRALKSNDTVLMFPAYRHVTQWHEQILDLRSEGHTGCCGILGPISQSTS